MTAHTLLCLASHSPRRRQLLESLGVPFFVRSAPAEVEEVVLGEGRGEQAEQVAAGRAEAKGRAVLEVLRREQHPVTTVLAADTVVHLGRRIMDKPADREQALEFLSALSGRRHGVVTGLWFFHLGQEHSSWRRTWVEFDSLSRELTEAYVDTGEPFDKAGGYGIQGPGAALIRGIEGCYYNVMGLPVNDTYRLLRESGFRWKLGGPARAAGGGQPRG
jgi:septum formation protein